MMNKKGAAPAIVWILVVIAGIFFANQVGLFSVFTPNVGQPTGTDSLVNPFYYEAVSDFNFQCQVNPLVLRADNYDWSSGWIAYDYNGDGSKEGFKFNRIVTDPDKGIAFGHINNAYINNNKIYIFKGSRTVEWACERCCKSSSSGQLYCSSGYDNGGICSSGYPICKNPTYKTVYDYYEYTLGTIPSSAFSQEPCTSCYEVYSNTGKTYVEEYKYACRDGNVVQQNCHAYINDYTIVQRCESTTPCQFLTNQQTNDGNRDVVKCKNPFKPNQNLCVGNILYQTNADGTLLTPTVCGFDCINGACRSCNNGEKRCAESSSTKDIEICINNEWQTWTSSDATCEGSEICVESNGDAQCYSEFTVGEERCEGNQPQVFNSNKQWVNEGEKCDIGCKVSGDRPNTDASCVNECPESRLGFHCTNGIMHKCTDEDRDYEYEYVGTCNTGECNSESQCEPRYSLGDKYCSQGNVFVARPSNDDYDLNGGIIGEIFGDACSNGCITVGANDATCRKADGCSGKGGLSVCLDAFTRADCSSNELFYELTEDCSTKFEDGFCDESITGSAICNQPEDECTGELYCTTGGVIRQCDGGNIGAEVTDCNGLGCSVNKDGLAICNDECSEIDSKSCKSGDSYKCSYVDTDNRIFQKQKLLVLDQECGTIGCDDSNGNCRYECTGEKKCVNGVIYSCTFDKKLGGVLDECNSIGCDITTNKCINECFDLNAYQCSGKNSILCYKNETNEQYLERTIECGIDGCSSSTGKCISTGKPNSFTCRGQAIHPTDSSGFALPDAIKVCSVESLRNGLQPYCSEGINDCKVCEENQYICDSSGLSQCANPLTGDRKNVQLCEAGCSKEGSTYYCDQVSATIGKNQNFFSDEDVIVEGLLIGSQTEKGIKTAFTAKIEGAGATETKTGTSDSSGNIRVNFGKKPIGEYAITITLDNLQKVYTITSRVTNDYRVKIAGSQVVTKIPGVQAKATIEAVDKSGGVPDDVIVSDVPEGLIINTKPTSLSGQWNLEVDGEPGIYSVGLSPVKNQIELMQQFIEIEVRKPLLGVSTNLPVSAKKGKGNYDITISGPTGEGMTSGIKPESISATISHSPAEDLILLDLGSGTYTFEYDFTDLGTYTINVEVSKEGYDSTSYSHQIQISESGNAEPPSSGTSTGTSTGTSDTETGTSDGTKDDITKNKWAIVIIIAIIIFFMMKGGKRR